MLFGEFQCLLQCVSCPVLSTMLGVANLGLVETLDDANWRLSSQVTTEATRSIEYKTEPSLGPICSKILDPKNLYLPRLSLQDFHCKRFDAASIEYLKSMTNVDSEMYKSKLYLKFYLEHSNTYSPMRMKTSRRSSRAALIVIPDITSIL